MGTDDASSIVAVLALGMCRALSEGVASPAYACHRLFGPAVLATLREAGAAAELLEALNLASELDAVARLIPDAFGQSLKDVEARLVDVLRSSDLRAVRGEKWLQGQEYSTSS